MVYFCISSQRQCNEDEGVRLYMDIDIEKLTCGIQLTDIERNVLEYLLTHLDQALKLEYVVWPGKTLRPHPQL